MKMLLLPLLAAAALAAPAVGSANHGHHGDRGNALFRVHRHAILAKLSGTGTSFASAAATASGSIARSDKLGAGTFAASIATDSSKATTRTRGHGTLTCAPATATLTLTGTNTADTTHATLTGRTCTWTPTGGSAVSAFFGRGAVTGTGALASVTGNEKAFLFEKADGTVKGAVFVGLNQTLQHQFAFSQHEAAHKTGDCDHD